MLITIGHLKSQFSCTPSYYCGLDLRENIYGNDDFAIETYNYGKMPQSANFKDWEFPEDCEEDPLNDKCRNDNGELFFVVHYPKDTAYQYYSTCPLPVIFMFHPGGFADCSSLENITGIQYMCNEFAKRGFVVFNVEYRRGRLLVPKFEIVVNPNEYKTIFQQVAVYRAVQDARGAIRSALKMQADGVFGTKFKFDETKVFGAGASAGAGTILTLTYLQKQDMIDEISPGFNARLGNIDVDYYYAPPSDPLPDIRGVLNMWGNFPMPGSIKTPAQAATFFNRNNYLAPMIAFQGLTDDVVKFNNRYEKFPPNRDLQSDGRGNYDTTTFCIDNGGLISITPATDMQDLLMIGPFTLKDLLVNAGKEAEVYLDCEMGHGLDDDCCPADLTKKPPNCTQTCPSFLSDFGTGSINTQQVQLYMVQRTSIFFQSIITNSPINGTSRFIDCENYRNSCNSSDDDNNCNNSDQCQ